MSSAASVPVSPAGGAAATETVGMALGKYCPFHKGHEWVVATALAECSRVVVVIYDAPTVTDIPLTTRAGWIRTIFDAETRTMTAASGGKWPRLLVIEGWMGPNVTGNTPDIQKLHDDYLREVLAGHKVTHFYSSEFYGDHVSKGLGAVDRRLDPDRVTVPTSGTMCRAHPYTARKYLSPCVYRDLVTSVVFVGAPSTGKSTMAERMAREFGTTWMPEYGREYWEAHHVERRLSPEQLLDIARGHIEREDAAALEADAYLFVDTNALTTAVFARHYHAGAVLPELVALEAAASRRYDVVFLCEDDIPYADTWDRSGDGDRALFQKYTRAALATSRTPYISLRGSVEERVATVRRVLARFNKWRGAGSLFASFE